jgi:hypothetical protein
MSSSSSIEAFPPESRAEPEICTCSSSTSGEVATRWPSRVSRWVSIALPAADTHLPLVARQRPRGYSTRCFRQKRAVIGTRSTALALARIADDRLGACL